MIRGFLMLIVSTLILLSANAKENLTNPLSPLLPFMGSAPQMVYSSDWETVPAWQLSAGSGALLYTYSRPLELVSASVVKEGVVVVFAKGYDFEGVSKAEEKPLELPFYMAMASEAVLYPYAWSYAPEEGRVTIGLSMHPDLEPGFESAQKDIRLRFFVLAPDFLRQHKLNPMAVRKMPYNKLVALLNTTP